MPKGLGLDYALVICEDDEVVIESGRPNDPPSFRFEEGRLFDVTSPVPRSVSP